MICPHGMPTPAACVDCMADGPVAPPPPGPEQRLRSSTWVTARHPGRCERRSQHEVAVGDRIYLVAGVGWCCSECAE